MRVLSWNLFHGRAVPAAGRDLRDEFAQAIAGWDWDVALLQEVPPWWPPALARACDAQQRTALTSRNALPALRRAIADRAPDLIKSNGGGANAILVRSRAGRIVSERRLLLRRLPERRVCHAVLLDDGTWWANLHAQVHSPQRAGADIARAAAAALAWARGAPVVLGGDFNVREPAARGFARLGGHGVDHILGSVGDATTATGADPAAAGRPAAAAARGAARRNATVAAATELPDRGPLSDHAPIVVTVASHGPAAAG